VWVWVGVCGGCVGGGCGVCVVAWVCGVYVPACVCVWCMCVDVGVWVCVCSCVGVCVDVWVCMVCVCVCVCLCLCVAQKEFVLLFFSFFKISMS